MALRVLLADDQLATRHIVRFNLEQFGFEVLDATDGQEAWKILNEQQVHLLVTDDNMPRLSGIQLCEKLRQVPALACLPVVMITAVAPAPNRATLERLGIEHCFMKPFSPRELLDKICEILWTKAGQTASA
ncbi:MAG TPA: response regulator [Pirellulales bacterium]|nr:response regulator [Pirellulales bacterium]